MHIWHIFFSEFLVQYLLRKSQFTIKIVQTFLLALNFQPTLFSGNKLPRFLPGGSLESWGYVEFFDV